MVNINNLPDMTPVKKKKTEAVREAMLSFSEERLSVKELAALLGVAYSVCSSMCSLKSPVRMRLKHLKKFISHFPGWSIEDLLLEANPAVPAEKLVETYFDLPGEYNVPSPAPKKKIGEDEGGILIPEAQRKKFVSGIYYLFGYREGWEFCQQFGAMEEEWFLKTGKIPPAWVEKIGEQTDFEKFVSKFQNQNKERSEKGNENIPSATEDIRQFINDMPTEVFKAIVSAFANAGLAKEINLSLEVLLGTLSVKLRKNYTVTLVNDRVAIRGEKDGRPVSIFLDGKFPWDTKKNEV